MDDFRFKPKRLTKQPPPSNSTSTTAVMSSNTSYAGLQQQPSASQSPASPHNGYDQYQQQQRTPTSSNSSLDRSPNPNPHNAQYPAATPAEQSYGSRRRYSTRQSMEDQYPDPHPGVLSSLDSTKATGYQNSLRRPGPPPLSHTAPSRSLTSPSIRHSSSFSMGDRTISTIPSETDSSFSTSINRNSDEATGSRNSTPWKKKSGVSSFIGSLIGSPRSNSVKISAPENPVHVTHVGFDNDTGQFTVRSPSVLPISPYRNEPDFSSVVRVSKKAKTAMSTRSKYRWANQITGSPERVAKNVAGCWYWTRRTGEE